MYAHNIHILHVDTLTSLDILYGTGVHDIHVVHTGMHTRMHTACHV